MNLKKIMSIIRWLGLAFFLSPLLVSAQTVEMDCPTAAYTNLGPSPTVNNATQGIKKWLCVDVFGNVNSNAMSYSGSGWPVMPNLQALSVFKSNAGTGDIDLCPSSWTNCLVPTNKRAIFIALPWNSTASSITFYPEVNIGGSYFATSTKQTLANTAAENNNTQLLYLIILEAGQKFAVNTTGTGLNVAGTVYMFDSTSPLRSSVITTFINGNNTVFTCCSSGKSTAYAVHGMAGLLSPGASVSGVFGVNNTATTISYNWNFVPSGGTAGTANQISISISTAATAGTPISFARNEILSYTNGDSLSVNSGANTAGQIAWTNIVEQP